MELHLVSYYPANPNKVKVPPLLFIHGAFSEARVWDKNFLGFFADNGYEAHALSLRGHGLSDGHNRIYTWRLSDYVDDVARTVEDNISQPPLLIGHSMGGMVIQKYLEKYPKVAGIILMASVPPQGLLLSNLYMLKRHPVLMQQMFIFSILGPKYGSINLLRNLLFSPDMPEEEICTLMQYAQPESYLVTLDMMGLDPLKINPDNIKVPILVLGTNSDVFIAPALVCKTAAFYHAKYHIFNGIAHAMMLDRGWKNVADYIKSWIEYTAVTNYKLCN